MGKPKLFALTGFPTVSRIQKTNHRNTMEVQSLFPVPITQNIRFKRESKAFWRVATLNFQAVNFKDEWRMYICYAGEDERKKCVFHVKSQRQKKHKEHRDHSEMK